MKKIILCLASFFLCFLAFGLDFSVKLEPDVSYSVGNYGEYVFDRTAEGNFEKLSYLDWDLSFWSVGLTSDISFDFTNNHRLSILPAVQYGFPQNSGFMQDYDWKNLDGVLTDYSCHNNLLSFYLKMGLSLQYKLAYGLGFSLDWQWKQLQFGARGGYKEFPLEEGKEKFVYDENEPVVDYNNKTHIVGLGVFYSTNLLPHLELSLFAEYIPFVYTVAQDYHVLTYTFIDIMTGFSGYRSKIAFNYLFTEKSRLALSFFYEYIPVYTGENYMRYYGDSLIYRTSSLGGSSWQDFSISLSYRYDFF